MFTATINIPNRCGIAISSKSVTVGDAIYYDYSITGNDALCTNGTATYAVGGLPTGSTIAWTSSNNNVATISAGGVASWVSSGTVMFTATINIPNRCGITIANKFVTVGDAVFSGNSITGDNTVCGTSSDYTISNLPAGASVYWQATPNQIVTIDAPYATQTKLISYANGVITLTANISNGCNISISKPNIIVTGPPTITCQTIGNGSCNQQITLCPSQLNTWQYFSIPNYNPPGAAGFQLTAFGGGYFSGGATVINVSTDYWATHDIGVFVPNNGNNSTDCNVTVRAVNCGVSQYVPYVVTFPVMTYGCGYSSYSVSPNPATSTITVSPNTKVSSAQNKAEKTPFTEIEIIDKLGNFKKRLKFSKGTNTATIDISFLPTDTYLVRVFNGTNWEEYKILVAK
ncbi:MAG: T9SS type A sorting domain-containing protein [Chitinophagaceae bacterium]|nr:T9SS type A sorting domain-containing protein [Chitinophagaceae bacterium]